VDGYLGLITGAISKKSNSNRKLLDGRLNPLIIRLGQIISGLTRDTLNIWRSISYKLVIINYRTISMSSLNIVLYLWINIYQLRAHEPVETTNF